MTPDDLSDAAPGELVRLGDGWAYLPAPLPPELTIDRDLLRALDAANTAVTRLSFAASSVENDELVTMPLARTEAVLSSRIEGTQTEILELVSAEATPEMKVAENSDLFEVQNYLRALDWGTEQLSHGRAFSRSVLLEMHTLLMRGVRGADKNPGGFRRKNVVIGSPGDTARTARFVPPPLEFVQPLVDDLWQFLAGEAAYTTLIDCALFHYQFETIHPFEDGNGRLGRLAIPLFLQSRGLLQRPILYLSRSFEERRDQYIDLLHHVSTRGEWRAWVVFFLEAVRTQAEDAALRVQRIIRVQDGYRAIAQVSRSRVEQSALALLLREPIVTVSTVARHARATDQAARNAIAGLEQRGVLTPYEPVRVGRGRPAKTWLARALVDAAYG